MEETSFEFKETVQTGAILKELDAARAIFDVLAQVLDNNEGFRDLHSLAALAADGRGKLDHVADLIDRAA